MIDLNDFITHETLRKKPRYKGEVSREKRYACYCESCGVKRGYIKKSHYHNRCKNKKCGNCVAKMKTTKEKIRKSLKKYNQENPHIPCPEKVLKRRLSTNLRNRLNRALKENYKTGSAVRDLGCSIEELKKHLEKQFDNKMTWDNYGKKGWHIDHIKPLSSFDLSSKQQFKEACHYTNLQPLWWRDNLHKGSS